MNESKTPHYHLVPKDYRKNAKYRRDIIRAAAKDESLQADIRQMCSQDILYWINTFEFTFDPRCRECSTLPFITYPFQDEALLDINDAIDAQEDRIIEKSRDMGLSWLMLEVIRWRWLFIPGQSFLLGSRKEELVDKEGDPKCLFWKLCFNLNPVNCVSWMSPRYTRKKLHLLNEDNGSTIDGESTNSDFARGDRRTAILLDEFPAVQNGHDILSATADASNCRFFLGTPKGIGNAHYDVREKGETKILRYHWSVHPLKRIGLYTSDEEGNLQLLDEDHNFKDGYPFIRDQKLRSPWYDAECRRRIHPVEIAQELDIDYRGSSYQFFEPTSIHSLELKSTKHPFSVGEVDFDDHGYPGGFQLVDGGRLKLWINLTPEGDPPDVHSYVAGADVAQGTGASNSCLVICDKTTGEQVAEFVSPTMRPDEFGLAAVALCRWFVGPDNLGAMLAWESNGPGRGFGDAVEKSGYTNIFYRPPSDTGSIKTKHKFSGIPGWHSSDQNKLTLLMTFRKDLVSGAFGVRSKDLLDECLDYEFAGGGKVQHVKSKNTADPTGARDNHGDRVIAGALADMLLPYKVDEAHAIRLEPEMPINCFKSRQDAARKAARECCGRW